MLLRSMILPVFLCALAPLSTAKAADTSDLVSVDEKRVQFSSVFTNDFLGDGDDRWRTFSWDVSATFGGGDLRVLPSKPFERFQIRLRTEVIAPESLSAPVAGDRQLAGIIGLGAFSHFQASAYEVFYGGELVFVGENTGVSKALTDIHDSLDFNIPSAAVLANQIPNAVYPTIHAGISRSIRHQKSLFRPFAEAQAGAETFIRVGADTVFGGAMIHDFLLRDSVSGQLVTHSKSDQSQGFGFLLGADAAYVVDSNYLANSGASKFKEFRPRARAGLVYQAKKFDAFYGATWLGKEFEGQSDDQIVGSLSLRLSF